MEKLKVGLLCGGPSRERGISLNSARSVLDHLQAPDVEIRPIYFDLEEQAFELLPKQLYSNTPSDFDFKIEEIGRSLSDESLIEKLRAVDIVFPAIHGAFGEDGRLQQLLERNDVPHVGSEAEACLQAFDKYEARQFLKNHGYFTLPAILIEQEGTKNLLQKVTSFFDNHVTKKAVVKPASAGSSIGVKSVETVSDALEHIRQIFKEGIDNRVIVERFCDGKEFTLVLLENQNNQPIALLPTEIEVDMFLFREKYLPTLDVVYHTPPRFDDQMIRKIQTDGEALFRLFGLRDFARIDGWVLKDGNVWFSDFNLISGMEQNSFLFLQAAQIGMSHADVLRYILKHACDRYQIPCSSVPQKPANPQKARVNVIFGGNTSERHVSLMSGTNVWLKLLRSETYKPHPYLLDPSMKVWELPYGMTLRHTVEEVDNACEQALDAEAGLRTFREEILSKLNPEPGLASQENFTPREISLDQFIKESPIIFIALHGGMGENGELQEKLEDANVPYTGSNSQTSRLCMDKYQTSEALKGLEKYGIYTAKKSLVETSHFESFTGEKFHHFWEELKDSLGCKSIIVKPSADGCSSGIARLYSEQELQCYVKHILDGATRISENTFQNQPGIIEMPTTIPERLLFEEFIETDEIRIEGTKLVWESKTDWIEVTVGLIGSGDKIHALTPSITVASGDILSLEEKFQGGTGVNITPPPESYVSPEVIVKAKKKIEIVAQTLNISGFARIDAFLSIETGDIIVIEANTIPGLTPSTVIYHQALSEPDPLYPIDFLEKILEFATDLTDDR